MDPAKMKVVDLRSELGALGLDTKGNKPALVERLKKALEAKTGKVIPDTSILDTSNEDVDEPSTPRRGPAARTTRRSSSSRLAATPAKNLRDEPPEPIDENSEEQREETPSPEPVPPPAPQPVQAPPPQPVPKPVPPPVQPPEEPTPKPETPQKPAGPEDYTLDNDSSQSPPAAKDDSEEEPMDTQETPEPASKSEEKKDGEVTEEGKTDQEGNAEEKPDDEEQQEKKERKRELTEEEEWEELNKRLAAKEKERLERERLQAEEDAKRLEELSDNPVKLQRLKRKQEKKARWSNFYRSIEVTNEVLTPPVETVKPPGKGKKEQTEAKVPEPELDDDKITLSWYDSDLNQYLEAGLASVVPLSDGAFAHAWAGARASHGVTDGRICYEVRVGSVVTTTESAEKETIASGLRIGWSTDDSSLHLGEGELSWGYESSARAVHNSEFKEYGQQLNEKDVVGAYLDLESNPCKISYTVNGVELGEAFEFDKSVLGEKALFPHVLTKNTCYRVNFGYDRYNMLTRTKIVRQRVEIPVEQVLEEKKRIEEEMQRQKEEAQRIEKERREREKKEREERQRKKREEREKLEREKKEKEKQERLERGEEPSETEDAADKEKDKDAEKEKDKDAEKEKDHEMSEADDGEKQEEPKENGDQAEKASSEPMDTQPPAEPEQDKPKDAPEGEVQEVTEEQVLKGHVLDKRIKFVIRYTVEEELEGVEACLVPGYVFISAAALVPGPRRPASLADCEVILMVGMPGAGKTHWARQHMLQHPQRRYNLLSTGALFDRMKVDCKPFRASYDGRWDAMVSKCAKCVLKLLEMARARRRNYILDQTNVYPSAQRRKLREFEGYRRVAVVVVTDDDTYRERQRRREEADGKEVPDGAVMDMKANFTLPEKSAWLDEVVYPELDAAAAKAVVEQFHKEARAAGVGRERRAASPRDQPPAKRARDDRPKDRDRKRDREDRWGGGGGGGGGGRGGRWGEAGGRGGRWGREPPRGPPSGRFDRPWPSGPPSRDFSRERDGFRGGRGGGGGRGMGERGGRGGGGERGGRGGGPAGDQQRFGSRDRSRPPHQQDNKRPPPHGGSGSWQRGGGPPRGGAQPQPRAAPPAAGPLARQNSQKDTANQGQNQNQQNQQNQQGWNQWAGGWGGWGNWNQNQAGWGNWGNWGNWGAGNAAGSGQAGAGKGQQAQQQQQQQWPAGYTPQQWYQWQQWQQQQQNWQGYGQQTGQAGSAADAQAQWAQYYQNYNAANAASTTNTTTDKQ